MMFGLINFQRSGTIPGVGMVHAPFAIFPMSLTIIDLTIIEFGLKTRVDNDY